MTRTMLRTLLIGTAAWSLTLAIASAEEGVDFRGIRPGTTLAEFRTARLSGDIPNGLKVFCEGDKLPAGQPFPRKPSPLTKAAGWSICQYYRYEPIAKYYFLADIAVGQTHGSPAFYFYAPPGSAADPRLFMIDARVPSDAMGEIARGLAERYGPPTSSENTQLQNAFGAKFDNHVLRWARGEDEIYVQERDGRINQGSIHWRNMPLSEEALKSFDRAKGPNSKNL